MTENNTKQCPYCKSDIPADAIKCKFCWEFVEKKEEVKKVEKTNLEQKTIPTKICRFCKSEIPKNAMKCPNCWTDFRNWFQKHPIKIIIFILLIWLVVSVVNSVQESIKNVKQDKLLKQADNLNIDTWSWDQKNIQKISDDVKKKNQEILDKIEIVSKEIKDEYWFNFLVIKLKNNSWKDIDWLSIKSSFADNFDRKVLESISWKEFFYWTSQEMFKSWKTTERQRQLSLFDNATKIKTLEIFEVHFTDWQTVSIE